MSSFTRFSAILFALLLSCASIGRNMQDELLMRLVQAETGHQQAAAHLSEKQLYDVFGIPQGELVVGSVNSSLPAPASKLQSNNFLSGSFSIELKIRTLVSDYLLQAQAIIPGLRVAVIIFPFHYFW